MGDGGRSHQQNRSMDTLSVNTAIERLIDLDGSDVAIFGELTLDFVGNCISHLPLGERLPDSETGLYKSSIWTRFDFDAIGKLEQWLMQFNGRNVVLHGTLYGPAPGYEGCGHFAFGLRDFFFVQSSPSQISLGAVRLPIQPARWAKLRMCLPAPRSKAIVV